MNHSGTNLITKYFLDWNFLMASLTASLLCRSQFSGFVPSNATLFCIFHVTSNLSRLTAKSLFFSVTFSSSLLVN